MKVQWAEIVLNWLEASDLRQAWLARRLRVSAVHWNRCLHGKNVPSDVLLNRAEEVMGLEKGHLVALKNGKVPEPA